MAKVFIEETTLTAIGDAIREKTGSTDLIAPGNMPTEIKGIVSGGSGDGECSGLHIPEEALTITNAQQYQFGNNAWNWFIEEFGDKISMTSMSGTRVFINSNELVEIPFDIHVTPYNNGTILEELFEKCDKLAKYPDIYVEGTGPINAIVGGVWANDTQNIFFGDNITIAGFSYDCMAEYKKDYPEWFFNLSNIDWDVMNNNTSTFGTALPVNWSNCHYVRKIPIMKDLWSVGTSQYYSHWYQFTLSTCKSLEEIVLPRPGGWRMTSNQFSNKFYALYRLRSMKFDVQEDGTPYTAEWQKQTIDLTSNIGYAPSVYNMPEPFTEEDIIDSTDDWSDYCGAPTGSRNWFADSVGWSTFGVTAARELINTLPDTSAYLESSGGTTNTIKFNYRNAMSHPFEWLGSNLTEEDIAVATAKGWTVTLVN